MSVLKNKANINTKTKKLELLKRSCALQHKLKVLRSGPIPVDHESLAVFILDELELESELTAIDQIFEQLRETNRLDLSKRLRSSIESKNAALLSA